MADAGFSARRVDVTFTIASGGLGAGAGGADSVTLSGLRCQAHVVTAALPTGCSLSLRIAGMTPDLMNRLSLLAALPVGGDATKKPVAPNTVTLSAGNGDATCVVFAGMVADAYADFSGAPDVTFIVSATSLALLQVWPLPATSHAGTCDYADMLADIATGCGLGFRNGGFHHVATDYYNYGSARDQIERIRAATHARIVVDGNVLSVWPAADADAATGDAVVISAPTGMIGYPSYNQYGVTVDTLFNPALRLWTPVSLQADYVSGAAGGAAGNISGATQDGWRMAANGMWLPYAISHELDTMLPGGMWRSSVQAVRATATA